MAAHVPAVDISLVTEAVYAGLHRFVDPGSPTAVVKSIVQAVEPRNLCSILHLALPLIGPKNLVFSVVVVVVVLLSRLAPSRAITLR